MKKSRKDINHTEILKAAQAMGATVIIDLAQHRVSCDVLIAFRGDLFLIEIKNPEYMTKTTTRWNWLTESEKAIAEACACGNVPFFIVQDIEELKAVLFNRDQRFSVPKYHQRNL